MPNISTYTKSHIKAWINAGAPQNPNSRNWKKFFGMKVISKGLEDGKIEVQTEDNRLLVAKEDVNEALKKVYFDTKTGFTGTRRLYDAAIQQYAGITRADVGRFLTANSAHQQHRAKKTGVTIKPIVAARAFSRWQVDLVDMSDKSRHNSGYHWILTCVDLFTKFAWVRAMKNKTAETTAAHMKSILEEAKHTPSVIQSDNGGEFNGAFDTVLENESVKHVRSTSHTPQTQGQVERFNGMLKMMINRYLTANQTKRWVDEVQNLVHSYNHTKHRTTGKRPIELADDTVPLKEKTEAHSGIIKQADKARANTSDMKPLKVGDWVRVSLQTIAEVRANKFRKSSERQWTREIYKVIKSVNHRNKGDKSGAITKYYRLEDENGEKVEGLFHLNRLLFTVPPDEQIHPPVAYQGKIRVNSEEKETRGVEEPSESIAARVKRRRRKPHI